MKPKTSEPVLAIRRALHLDTWGQDLYRMKHKLDDLIERVEKLENQPRQHERQEHALPEPDAGR